MKNVIAIILCKGNSKGIKNKNLKKIFGKPLMYWTIESLRECTYIKKIYVSSESEKILKYAKNEKLECIKRPKTLSRPKTQSEEALFHAIKNINCNFDYVVFPQVTSPLRPKKIFESSLKFFFNNKLDSLFSSNIPSKIFMWEKEKKKMKPMYNIYKRPMRQNIKNIFLENGSFYIFKKMGFLKNKNRIFGKVGTYLIDKKYSFDIDEEIDFDINKLVMKRLGSR